MERLKNVLTLFEWAYENKPRLFGLGIVIGAVSMYFIDLKKDENSEIILADLRQEIKMLKEENIRAQKDCMDKIKEVKEFLKQISSE